MSTTSADSDFVSDSTWSPMPSSSLVEPPFTQTSFSDAILRSSDGAEFYVHRAILSIVSPVFATMFELPQPDPAPTIPVIDVQEDSVVLNRALRFFYPGTNPTIVNVDELPQVLSVLVDKYDMQVLVPIAKEHLNLFVPAAPLAVYAVAVSHQWKDTARKAAKEALKFPIRALDEDAPKELLNISGVAYHNLLRYHYLCGADAKNTTQDLRWTTYAQQAWFQGCSCPAHPYKSPQTLANGSYHCRKWFMDYFLAMGDLLGQAPATELWTHGLFDEAVKIAMACGSCYNRKFYGGFVDFVAEWQGKIQDELAKVDLRL